MRRTTTCSSCRTDVPAGRWCNWCGAGLVAPAPTRPRPRPGRHALGGLALVAVLATGMALASGGDDPGDVGGRVPSAVVLAEDAPPPPSATPSVGSPPSPPTEPPGERVDVICSDLRVRSVPVSTVATDVPGELVELANGTCVVMGPDGAVAP